MRFSVPGKVFILGEYLALSGGPSIVAAIGPRFTGQTSPNSESVFHPESPAGKLNSWAVTTSGSGAPFHFQGEFSRSGGFGGSTAEFALAYRVLAEKNPQLDRSWKSVFACYRELTDHLPSGADLIGQWLGGVTCFDRDEMLTDDLSEGLKRIRILVFSAASQAGRKVQTHAHLETLSNSVADPKWLAKLREWVAVGRQSFAFGDGFALGKSFQAYADLLAEKSLECQEAREDRTALSKIPGVFGVKGSGALLSDALVAVVSDACDTRSLTELARTRDLQLVTDRLTYEPGMRVESEL